MTLQTEVAELIAAAESYQKAHLKVSDLKEFGGPEYMYGSEWREATCGEGNEYCRLTNAVRACKELAAQQIAPVAPESLDTGNLADDPLYKALDALYERGWEDYPKKKYDPRGTKQWDAVLFMFRYFRDKPEEVAPARWYAA